MSDDLPEEDLSKKDLSKERSPKRQEAPQTRPPRPWPSAHWDDSFAPESVSGVRWACGAVLSVLGVVLLLASGGCAIYFLVWERSNVPSYLPLLLTAPAILIGILLWWGGDRLRWRR